MGVFELPSHLFENALLVLGHPPADFAYIDAGLRGINPARIFVDDPDRPTAALMTRTYNTSPAARSAPRSTTSSATHRPKARSGISSTVS